MFQRQFTLMLRKMRSTSVTFCNIARFLLRLFLELKQEFADGVVRHSVFQ